MLPDFSTSFAPIPALDSFLSLIGALPTTLIELLRIDSTSSVDFTSVPAEVELVYFIILFPRGRFVAELILKGFRSTSISLRTSCTGETGCTYFLDGGRFLVEVLHQRSDVI